MTLDVDYVGRCCGHKSIQDFRVDRARSCDVWVTHIQRALDKGNATTIWTVNLTDNQLYRMPNLSKALKHHKFELVGRGRNENSGNIVNVFIRIPERFKFTDRAPGWHKKPLVK